jgi:heme-degrading monooxygenase HmoA
MEADRTVYYTLGRWKVKKGDEDKFIEAWTKLGGIFGRLPDPPGIGTLIRSIDDPALFYSFGPWPSLESINNMRSDPASIAGIKEIMSLCLEAAPGNYKLVKEIKV